MGGCQKSWSLFGYPIIIRCRTIFGTPKRDHNFDNHAYSGSFGSRVQSLSPLLDKFAAYSTPSPNSLAAASEVQYDAVGTKKEAQKCCS